MMSIIEQKAPVFGFIAGLWLIWIGIYIYITGLQGQTGMTIETVGDVQTITNVYTDIIPPFSDYKTMWSIPFWAIGMYIMFAAGYSYNKKRKNG